MNFRRSQFVRVTMVAAAIALSVAPAVYPAPAVVKVNPPSWSDDELTATIEIEIKDLVRDQLFRTAYAEGGPAYLEFPPIVNTSITTEVGKPELPYVSVDVEVPRGTTASVSVLEIANTLTWEDIDIAPVREPWSESRTAVRPLLRPDPETYAGNAFFPSEVVRQGPRQTLRGVTVQTVHVYPFRYNPGMRKLQIHESLTINVNLTPERPTPFPMVMKETVQALWANAQQSRTGLYAHEFASSFLQYVEGYRPQFPRIPTTDRNATGCDYLVITPDAYVNELDRLLAPKRARGLITRVLTLPTLNAAEGDAKERRAKIQEAIVREYGKKPSPRYLLLVGDVTTIPAFTRSTHPATEYTTPTRIPTDLYYATVDGADILPDLLVGRLPARSRNELKVMIDKILMHENTIRAKAASHWGTMVVAAEYENEIHVVDGVQRTATGRWFHQTAYNVASFVARNLWPFTRVQQYYVARADDLQKPWHNRDGTEIPQAAITHFTTDDTARRAIHEVWAEDLRLLLHRDHGFRDESGGGWGRPSFRTEDVAKLSAPSIPPVVLSINCETGWYDVSGADDRSLAMALMRSPNGASAVVGASRISWSGYNDKFTEGLSKAIWPGFVLDFELPDTRQSRSIGEVVQYAKIHTQKYYADKYAQYTMELFNLFGDPEMPITTRPETVGIGADLKIAGEPVTILTFPATELLQPRLHRAADRH